jgi:hypothetical protein
METIDRIKDVSNYVRDGWRLVHHLTHKRKARFPFTEEDKSFNPHEALVELMRLRNTLFPIPSECANSLKAKVAEVDLQVDSERTGIKEPLQKLHRYARENLKGKERRVVELVCEREGACKLVDVAADPQIGWNGPDTANRFNA